MPDIIAYDTERAAAYRAHHRKNLRTRLSTARERMLTARALESLGPAGAVLDLACGTGRFWSVIAPRAESFIALDNSAAMLREALTHAESDRRPEAVCGSAFQLPFADHSFDVVVSMRFLHHLAHRDDRVRALREMRRVARLGAVVSLWTDGSAAGWRRLARQRTAPLERGFGRRVCIERSAIERDFRDAGFGHARGYAFAKWLSMWRLYALR